MKQGLWEMSGAVDMGGMKTPSKVQHCVTEKDLDGTWFNQMPGECTGDQKVTATTVTWALDCKMAGGQGSMKSTGKVAYTSTSFSGTATMEMKLPQAGSQTGSPSC
jgi:hypothetical protein